MLAGWAAIAAAILTVAGAVTLVAFFATGRAILGALNDVATILIAVATIPVALALQPIASETSGALATLAVAVDLIGVELAAGFSALLVARVRSFKATLIPITIGNGLIGVWLVVTSALLLAGATAPAGIGWLGFAGGAGMAVASLAFPALGRQHPLISIAGVVALVGLTGFFAWTGALLLDGTLGGA